MKTCSSCRTPKPVAEYWRGTGKDGLQSKCKPCGIAHQKEYMTSERRRGYNLQWLYNMTQEDWDAQMATQAGLCAICGEEGGTSQMDRLHTDHCHRTNRVRGLLCSMCNRGLGLFADSPELLEIAAEYLRSHS